MQIIDLSRDMYHGMPTYPGQPPLIHGVWKTHEQAFAESGNIHGNSVMHITMSDHCGTHIDAPRHFGKSGVPMDEYRLKIASSAEFASIFATLRHEPKFLPMTSKQRSTRRVSGFPRVEPSCCAPAIMSARFRPAPIRRIIPA